MASPHVPVQPEEIQAVQRENRPAFLSGKSEHFGIWNSLVGAVGLQRSQHVMPECPKALDGAEWKILVRVEPGHHATRLA